MKLKYFGNKTIDQATSEMNLNLRGKGAGLNTYTTSINDYICIVLGFGFKGESFTRLDCSYKPPFDCKVKKTKKNSGRFFELTRRAYGTLVYLCRYFLPTNRS
jgi:hypothetical protein